MQYTLDDENSLVPEPDWRTWHQWMMDNEDRLIIGDVMIGGRNARVITRFIGRNEFKSKEKLVFRTLIFSNPLSSIVLFWRSWDEADGGHHWVMSVVARVDTLITYEERMIAGEERRMPCTNQ